MALDPATAKLIAKVVISQITDTDIKYSYFLVGRLWQTIITGVITYFLCMVMI